MIYLDKKREMDKFISLTEYLASFWNPEAVKKVQEIRGSTTKHKFKDDKEFEDELVTGKYKDNPLLEHIINSRKILEQERKQIQELAANKGSKTKLPTDLSVIHSTIEKFRNGNRN